MYNKPTKIQLSKIPKQYSQDEVKDPKVYMKFFLGGWTWYATEFDGTDQFFGMVISPIMPQGELGYFSLRELQELNAGGVEVDRDLHQVTVYKPVKLSDILDEDGIKKKEVEGINDFPKDKDGKISNTSLSPYGKQMLKGLEGFEYKYSNGDYIQVKNGFILVNGKKTFDGKTNQTDLSVNRISFLVVTG